MKSKLIIFDLDGTLIDSKYDIAEAVNFAFQEADLTKLNEQEIFLQIGNGSTALIKACLGEDKLNFFDKVFKSYFAFYLENPFVRSQFYPDVLKVLENLKENVNLAILTNKPHELAVKIVEQSPLKDQIDFVVGGSLLPFLKPNSCGIDFLISKFSVQKEDVFMVGDSWQDIQAAKNAKVSSCFFTQGYSKSSNQEDVEAEFNFNTFTELKDYFSKKGII